MSAKKKKKEEKESLSPLAKTFRLKVNGEEMFAVNENLKVSPSN